jgi:hypothetical protein
VAIQKIIAQNTCVGQEDVCLQERTAQCIAVTTIVAQTIARKHKRTIQVIAYNTNAMNATIKRKKTLIFASLTTVMLVIVRPIDIKTAAIVLRISVIILVAPIRKSIVLRTL